MYIFKEDRVYVDGDIVLMIACEWIACSTYFSNIKGNEATHDFWSMKCFIFELG